MTVEYKIVICRGEIAFERSVEQALNDGWLPHGGISIAYPTTFIHPGIEIVTFAQAFTRLKEPKPRAAGLIMRGGGIIRRIRGAQ